MLQFAVYKQGPQEIMSYLSIDGHSRKERWKEGAEGRRQGQKRQKELNIGQSAKKQRSNTLTYLKKIIQSQHYSHHYCPRIFVKIKSCRENHSSLIML